MDKRLLLSRLKEAKDTEDKDLFLEVMKEIRDEGLGHPELMIEATDIILEIMDEWGWLDHMIEYTRNLVNENPSDSQAKCELACYYYKRGELDRAEVILASSLEFEENPLAQHYRDKIRKEKRGD